MTPLLKLPSSLNLTHQGEYVRHMGVMDKRQLNSKINLLPINTRMVNVESRIDHLQDINPTASTIRLAMILSPDSTSFPSGVDKSFPQYGISCPNTAFGISYLKSTWPG